MDSPTPDPHPVGFPNPHALLSSIVESSDDAIVSKDLNGTITSWNRAATRIFGYEPSEIIGKSVLVLIPEGLKSEEELILAKLRDGERIEHFETTRIHKDGRPVNVSLTISPMRNENGEIVGASKIARDITEQKAAAAAFKKQSERLEILNAVSLTLASEENLETVVQRVTDAGRELSEAAFGAFFYNTVGDDGEAYMLYTLSGAPREAFEKFGMPRNTPIFGPTFGGEGVVRLGNVRKDPRYGQMAPHRGMPKGHLPVTSYLAVPVISRKGNVIGGLFFGHPEENVFTEDSEKLVTLLAAHAAVAIDNANLLKELRAAERQSAASKQEAEHQSHIKDEFLATISHELRTPLQSIIGWSQILLEDRSDPAEVQNGMEVIHRNAEAQSRIIEDLLDMNRILTGKVRLDVQRINLSAVLEEAIGTIRLAADGKGVRLRTVIDPHSKAIAGDPGRLQQVFWNLLSNAIKFTPRGGSVQIVVEKVASHLEVSISDTGEGIDPDFLPHVFERFRQADQSSTRRQAGVGLGLAIVKNLVELHGGSVRAESAGRGHGATFVVSLPVAPLTMAGKELEQPNRPVAEDKHLQVPRLDGVSILLVDDEADTRAILGRIFTAAGAEVRMADSAAKALEMIDSAPTVLVSDIGMPDEDGYALIRKIRALPGPARNTPAVALTAFSRAQDRMRALSEGFQMHISKPANPSELILTVRALTQSPLRTG